MIKNKYIKIQKFYKHLKKKIRYSSKSIKMQEKPQETTTVSDSVAIPEQTLTEVMNVKERIQSESGFLQSNSYVEEPLATADPKESLFGKSGNQPSDIHEYTSEQFNQEYQSFQDDQANFDSGIEGYDPRDFERFNDVESNEIPDFSPQKVQLKPPVELKPIMHTKLQKMQELPSKKVQPSQKQTKSTQEKKQFKAQQKPVKEEKKIQETAQKKQQQQQKQLKNKSNKKKVQQSEALPVIDQNSVQGKKEIQAEMKKSQMKKVGAGKQGSNSVSPNKQNKSQISQGINQQQAAQRRGSQIKQVSQIILPSAISAGQIIFQAQRQRIGTTLDLFLKFTGKHQKHITNQKQLISNVQDQIQKRRISKTPLMNNLRDYFENFVSLCRDLYQKSYKFAKSDKPMSANPMVNMREQLKGGIDEMIFLRKSTGNEYNRLGEFVGANITKNVIKLFTQYWIAICLAQTKHKQKRQEFAKKQKQFHKRINKVIKVYTKGKQGSSQQEDLFIEMIKFINQEKQFRTCLIEYGMGLVPLKKAFIKAEQTLYEQLQVVFNGYKNQFRTFFIIHPKEFTQIEKMEKLIKDNSTFEKLSDITDSDYVRSVLITLEKGSLQNLTDKDFEKVLNMLHFEQIVGNSVQLLKGTTTKSFELKNKAEQVVDTVSGNLLIFNKQSAQMKQKFIIKNIDARIVQEGVVQIDQTLKGIIFDSHRTVRITFRDNDRAEELICFLNQVHENIKQQELANNSKK